ncbi:class I SAM-dependent methyltransferase [Deltaproteobacteria bacterium TL4]
MNEIIDKSCPFTGETEARCVFQYHERPQGEICFSLTEGQTYYREIWQFALSRHYISIHRLDLSALYTADYVNSNYKNAEGIKRNFERIINLPPEKSDNSGRVQNINTFAQTYWNRQVKRTVLDVGSGLGVFPYLMKQTGWLPTALDPDERAVKHSKEVIGIPAVQGDFMKFNDSGKFDLITFNKVLEHVENPILMLKKSHHHLKEGGLIYIELPDGEMAEREGQGREEFFIDHWHVFSPLSLTLLCALAGFRLLRLERLQEPSTKYTLRAFMTPEIPMMVSQPG